MENTKRASEDTPMGNTETIWDDVPETTQIDTTGACDDSINNGIETSYA